jgi:carboxyl-terminal processing protease
MRLWVRHVVLVLVAGTSAPPPAAAQSLSLDRQRGEMMLQSMRRDLHEHYYDPSFKGIDLDARVEAARQRVKAAASLADVLGIVAQVAADLNDSHTRFLPPMRATDVEYGWTTRFVGDQAYVREVDAGSDAARQGVKAGDKVLQIAQYTPTRDNELSLWYLLQALRPQPSLRVVVQAPREAPRTLTLASKVITHRAQLDARNENDVDAQARRYERWSLKDRKHQHRWLADGVHLWQMPLFDLSSSEVDAHFDRFDRASSLVLDLRGNAGGSEESMLRVIGNLFDRDVTVGQLRSRKEARPLVAKARGPGRTFRGEVVVLVDSDSASASEVVARVLQLEKRGRIAGDRTGGKVTRAITVPHTLGTEVMIYWGMQVTVSDLVHPDGQSLEHRGVTPDTVLLPSQEDLASGADPALVAVARSLGIELTPDQASTLLRNDE